jgi:hypothetical protein
MRFLFGSALAAALGGMAQGAYATELILVPQYAEVRTFVPYNDDLGDSWTGGHEPFDDQLWGGGQQGVGYAGPDDPVYFANLGVLLYNEMRFVSPSALIRIPFALSAVAEVSPLALRVRYDDGFVAYLNGHEVQRAGLGANDPVSWNTTVPSNPGSQGFLFEPFDLSAHISAVRDGPNILAIHGFNNSIFGQDFFIQAVLVAVVPEPASLGLASIAAAAIILALALQRATYGARRTF